MTSISASSISSSMLQQIQQSRQSLFQKADSDNNGSLSLEEFKAAGPKDAQGNAIAPPTGAPSAEDLFSSLDTDGDGGLSQSEMDAGFQKKSGGASQSFLSSDTVIQLLGQLSDEQTQALFDSADQNGDGSLSTEEFSSAIKGLVEETLSSGSPPAGGPPPGGPPPGGPPPGGAGGSGGSESDSLTQAYDALDTNQDGTVSLEELLASSEDEDSSQSSSSSSVLSLLDSTGGSKKNENSQSALSFNALKTEFTNFLLSLQEQQAA